MAYNYIVTAQKPTAVTHALVCNFTGPSDRNLVIAKSTRLEVHTTTPEGLVPELDAPIYGRITSLVSYRPRNMSQDVLFILTQRFKFCILYFDAESRQLVTIANGDMKDRVGRMVDHGPIAIVDPQTRVIGMLMYEGTLKILPIDSNTLRDAYNVRLEESNVVDLVFLHGCARPTVCILHEDAKQARHVTTYVLDDTAKELLPGAWNQSNVEHAASCLIPVPSPLGGLIILGGHTICYHPATAQGSFKSIAVTQMQILGFAKVDDEGEEWINGSRWLLGDHQGSLHLLVLENDRSSVSALRMDCLGETSIPNALCYLDNGVVFIGSIFGDSQLIKLDKERDESGSHVKILTEYLNVGPIVDMCVVDVDRQGQCQAVTCSGAYKDGSLRVVRSGIGIHEHSSVELSGIKGMWAIREDDTTIYDKYLVQSYIGETRILAIQDEELEEIEIEGFVLGETLFACNILGDRMLQVTSACARIVSCRTLLCEFEYVPPNPIIVATANMEQVAVALSGGTVLLLEMDTSSSTLIVRGQMSLEHDVACLSLRPFTPAETQSVPMTVDGGPVKGKDHSDILAVCAWGDMSVSLFSLPHLHKLVQQPLGVEVQARDVLLVTLDGTNYLFVGLGDGAVTLFVVESDDDSGLPVLTSQKKVVLGTHPIILNVFKSSTRECVFAACDRPTVVYASSGKLVYANVDVAEVSHMTSFNSAMFPDCLALASENDLTIGTVDEIQKLHVRTIPLKESPRRITYMQQANVFAVCLSRLIVTEEGPESKYRVAFFDNPSFEEFHSVDLDPCEEALSLATCCFDQSEKQYIVLGTAYVIPEEPEATKGRMVVFDVDPLTRQVVQVASKETRGAVFVLGSLHGKIVAGVGSKVQVIRFEDKPDAAGDLITECAHHGHILTLYIKVRGDLILVGDLMRSVVLLQYKEADNTIEEIARDFNANSMRAVEIMDDDFYMGADDDANVFVVRRNADAPTDEDRQRLELQGEFHIGDHINTIRKGVLNMQPPSDSPGPTTREGVLFACVTGMIGCVFGLSEDSYRLFASIERGLRTVVSGVGGLSHEEWRAFQNQRRTSSYKSIVDGDLVETFLDLNKEHMEQVVKVVNDDLLSGGTLTAALSTDEVLKRIEEISRMH